MEQNFANGATSKPPVLLFVRKLVQMILSNIPSFHLSSDLHCPDFLWDG